MAKLIMLIGVQGSGKTTYSKVLKQKYDARVISTDKIRQTFLNIEEKDVFPTLYKLCAKELRQGYNVIIDATHITPKVRKRTFDALNEFNVNYEKVAYYIKTPLEVCVKRVDIRNQDPNELFLPLEVIESYFKNLIPPTEEEGFNEIHILDVQ